MNRSTGWIRFPYYHHVFSDERCGFARQMDYLKNFGEFISIDQAVEMFTSQTEINGRFFCITFDDGIKSCHEYAAPILTEREIPAAFFIVTEYAADTRAGERHICKPLHSRTPFSFEYLTGRECAEMVEAGMTIGSHTCSHINLVDLAAEKVRIQMRESKRVIEEKLGTECNHFACPWGGAGKDFHLQRDVNIAKELGYNSFLTTQRGRNQVGCSPFAIRRDQMYSNWGNYQLRYFLSL